MENINAFQGWILNFRGYVGDRRKYQSREPLVATLIQKDLITIQPIKKRFEFDASQSN